MKNLHNGGGSVVSLGTKFIFNGLRETVETYAVPGINSWEEAEGRLNGLYEEGEAPASVKEALDGLRAGVDFENSDADTDPRSESFSSMTQLRNAIVGSMPSADDQPKIQKFVDQLRDFYEPIVQSKEVSAVIDSDRAEMAGLVDKIMAHSADKARPTAETMTVSDAETASTEEVEAALSQIEAGPKTPSQPVLTVSTKVADLSSVLADTEGEMRARGYNPDNFAPDLFA